MIAALLLSLLLAAPTTLDVTTYVVREGFELLAGGKDHASVRRVDPANWVLFSVYGGRASSRGLAMEFAADWKDVGKCGDVPAPSSVSRKVGGKIVSILVNSGSEQGFTKTYRKTIETFLSGLIVKAAPRGDSVATGAPAPAGKSTSLTAATLSVTGMRATTARSAT